MKVHLISAPLAYSDWIGGFESLERVSEPSQAHLVHVFTLDIAEFEEVFHHLAAVLSPTAVVWVSWYKKSSGKSTGISENNIPETALSAGWVDIKVCAVNEDWSGLKLVKRKQLR